MTTIGREHTLASVAKSKDKMFSWIMITLSTDAASNSLLKRSAILLSLSTATTFWTDRAIGMVSAFQVEGWGAHPSYSVEHVNLEIDTGEPLRFESVFRAGRLDGLLELLNAQLRKAVAKAPPLEGWESLAAETQAARFQREHLNQFVVLPEGLLFYYRFDYPHAVRAIQPDDTYVIPSTTAAKFVSPTGPLEWMRSRPRPMR